MLYPVNHAQLLYAGNQHEVGLILMGTKDSQNELNDQDPSHFKNIIEQRMLEKCNPDFLREVKKELEPEKAATKADIGQALRVAIDAIQRKTKKLKYKRRIFLITDGESGSKTGQVDLRDIIS